MNFSWFPGHMKRTIDELSIVVKKTDLILHVVDARCINLCSNNWILKFNKPILKICNKADLCDKKTVKLKENEFFFSCKNKSAKKKLIDIIDKFLKKRKNSLIRQGLKNPFFYLVVVGLPNVGKSSLINLLNGTKTTIVKNQPATTQTKNIIKINNSLFLLDTPGILFNEIKDRKTLYKLALANVIKHDLLPLDEVTEFAYNFYVENYHNQLKTFYHFIERLSFVDFIIFLAKKRKYYLPNNKIDRNRAIKAFYHDLISGKICLVNYEKK